MKKIITASMLVLCINIFSQNINGKLGINGQFILRDTTNTFFNASAKYRLFKSEPKPGIAKHNRFSFRDNI